MNGTIYDMKDPKTAKEKERAVLLCEKLNGLSITQKEERRKLIEELFFEVGEDCTIYPGFHCDNGKNIYIGNNFTGNYNITMLDIREIYIGNNVMIGPNTLITTVNHPLSPMGRRKHLGIAEPVRIGDDVWIGGNVTILPGVTIGNNVVVGAGAVVTKDIPDNCVVGGVPAKFIKAIEDDTQ